jgi:hypothetical protein
LLNQWHKLWSQLSIIFPPLKALNAIHSLFYIFLFYSLP